MRVLMENISENEEAWIAQKINTIGSGDIATIVGANPFCSPLSLWATKTRRQPPEPENDHMRFGKIMERPISELAKWKLGLMVRYGNTLYGHESVKWAAATPDYFAVKNEDFLPPSGDLYAGEEKILECKNVGYRAKKFWDGVTPLYPRIQVMWQMGITGVKEAIIAPLIGGDHETFEGRLVRFDSRIFGQLMELAEKFRWHVESDTPPPATQAEDSKIINKIFPLLEDKCIALPIEMEPELATLKHKAEVRKKLEAEARELEDAEKIIKNRVRLTMGGAKRATCGSYNITCSMVNVKEKVTKGYEYARLTVKGGSEDEE